MKNRREGVMPFLFSKKIIIFGKALAKVPKMIYIIFVDILSTERMVKWKRINWFYLP